MSCHVKESYLVKKMFFSPMKALQKISQQQSIRVSLLVIFSLPITDVFAAPFTDSAHGNSTIGVKRKSNPLCSDYPQGNCTHCHEQHASINGSEPNPTLGESPAMKTLCISCHETNMRTIHHDAIDAPYEMPSRTWRRL